MNPTPDQIAERCAEDIHNLPSFPDNTGVIKDKVKSAINEATVELQNRIDVLEQAVSDLNSYDVPIEVQQLRQQLLEAQKQYNELLYAVARKFPNESRHQTALRYITEKESQCLDQTASSAIETERVKG